MTRKCMMLCLGIAILLAAAGGSWSRVNLEWRPAYFIARVGDNVDLGLYAVSDTGGPEALSAMDVIQIYDSGFLSFHDLIVEGRPYDWFLDGYMSPSPDNLNVDLGDGEMFYTAWAQFGAPAVATTRGLLVITLRFLANAPVCRTELSIPAAYGTAAKTKVFHATYPNVDIKGTLGTARVMIIPPTFKRSVVEAKALADEISLDIAGPIVTRAFESCFYLEDADRAAGIRVNCNPSELPAEGSTPTVSGAIRTTGGERVIDATSVTVAEGCAEETIPKPLGMNGNAPFVGLSPQGLLVRLCGRADVSGGSFTLNDGSVGPYGTPRAIVVELHGVAAPNDGDFVVVTGALGEDPSGPVLRVNKVGDLVRLASP